MIVDGRIAFKSGVTPSRFTEKSLVLSDGSELPADVVVFAYVETPAEPCPLSHHRFHFLTSQDWIPIYERHDRGDVG